MADVRDYVTLAELRAAPFSVKTSEADDTTLAALITASTIQVDEWAGQRFDKQTDVAKKVDGTESDVLFLPERILKTPTAVVMNDVALDASLLPEMLIKEDPDANKCGWDLTWKTAPWIPGVDEPWYEYYSISMGTRIWRYGFQNVVVTSDWGWSAVPKLIQLLSGWQVCRLVRGTGVLNEPVAQSGLQSESIGGYSYSRDSKAAEKSRTGDPTMDMLLKPYLRPRKFAFARHVTTVTRTPSGTDRI